MICKLCGNDRRLVKAHIVPEAFFRTGRTPGEEPLVLATSDPRTPPKRAPIGVYDRELVCEVCEHRFQRWDTYAAELFINRFDDMFRAVNNNGETIAFIADNVDYRLLKLFIISLLWRAGMSSQPYFQRVRIGPYAELAGTAVLTEEPGDEHFFSVLFSRWIAPPHLKLLETAHISPFRERWEGVNSVRIYLGKVVAYIKTDKRILGDNFLPLILKQGRPLALIAREIEGSKDIKAIRRVVANFREWHQR